MAVQWVSLGRILGGSIELAFVKIWEQSQREKNSKIQAEKSIENDFFSFVYDLFPFLL